MRALHQYPWARRSENAFGTLIGVVDVTRIKIQKPTMNASRYYCMKDQLYALKFEVVVSIKQPSMILWVSGPWKGAVPDITIAREMLLPALRHSEQLVADKAYIGEPARLITPIRGRDLNRTDRIWNARHARVHQVVERTSQRLKSWGCFRQTWRHDYDKCSAAFRVVSRITNCQLARGEHL